MTRLLTQTGTVPESAARQVVPPSMLLNTPLLNDPANMMFGFFGSTVIVEIEMLPPMGPVLDHLLISA